MGFAAMSISKYSEWLNLASSASKYHQQKCTGFLIVRTNIHPTFYATNLAPWPSYKIVLRPRPLVSLKSTHALNHSISRDGARIGRVDSLPRKLAPINIQLLLVRCAKLKIMCYTVGHMYVIFHIQEIFSGGKFGKLLIEFMHASKQEFIIFVWGRMSSSAVSGSVPLTCLTHWADPNSNPDMTRFN